MTLERDEHVEEEILVRAAEAGAFRAAFALWENRPGGIKKMSQLLKAVDELANSIAGSILGIDGYELPKNFEEGWRAVPSFHEHPIWSAAWREHEGGGLD